jgi:NTP pyrophosphatase (non-canonical NTP hydrolase)
MINNDTRKSYEQAIKLWTKEFQIMMLVEEFSELFKAINKRIRGKTFHQEDIMEEIADVQIMLEQMIVLFNIDEVELRASYMLKLDKMKKMIESDLKTQAKS